MDQNAWVSAGTPAPPTPPAPESPAPVPTPTPEAPSPPADPGAPPSTAADQQLAALEALLDETGEKKLSIPLTARLPFKQYGKADYVTVDQALKNHLFHRDYLKNNEALRAQQKEHERQRKEAEVERAAYQAERDVWEKEREKLRAVQEDPDKLEAYLQHTERLRTDPEYKQIYDNHLAKMVSDARSAKETELARYDEVSSATDQALEYITAQAARYPGVDPQRVITAFAQGLQRATPVPFTMATVDRLFQEESAYLAQAAAPVTSELQSLREKIAKLEAAHANEQVLRGVRQSARPTGGGAVPSAAPKQFEVAPEETMESASRRWAAQR